MTYERIVQRAQSIFRKQSDCQWAIGDLLLELVPIRGDRNKGRKYMVPGESVEDKLRQFISDAKCEYSVTTLMLMRSTAARWPKDTRIEGLSFTSHSIARSWPKRFELKPGMSPAEVRTLMHGEADYAHMLTSGEALKKSLTAAKTAERRIGEEPDASAVLILCEEIKEVCDSIEASITERTV